MRILALILFIAIPGFCDSKAEADLRARLAAAQAQLAEAARDKADLGAALAKLNAAAIARASAAAANARSAASGRVDASGAASAASDQADTIARNARDLAQDHADIAKAAADLAASKAEADRLRAEAAASSSKSSDHAILIVQICGLAAILGKFLYDYLLEEKRHTWAREDKEEVLGAVDKGQKASMLAVENSNHLTEKHTETLDEIRDLRNDVLHAVTAVAAIPDKTQTLIDALKLNGHANLEDIVKVVAVLTTSAGELEAYSHKHVHRLNEVLGIMLAPATIDSVLAKQGPPAAQKVLL